MSLLPRAPLVVIGLDGATFDVIDPLIARGELPTLARLVASGLRTELRSTLPSATMPAWTSFLTGEPPGQHGVTDLFIHGRDHTLTPANGRLRTKPTYLARMSAAGCRVAALGIPGTWPPEPINGICVAGFDAPGADRATGPAIWPREFADELTRFGGWRYAAFNEQRGGREQLSRAVDALLKDVARKERIALHVMSKGPWDVFALHLQASDTVGHHLWHTWDHGSPRYRPDPDLDDALPRVYRRLDRLLGRLLAAAPTETRVLVVSDHGMGGASDIAVHLNRWLADHGWLRFRNAPVAAAAGQAIRWGLARAPVWAISAASRLLPSGFTGRVLPLARGVPVDYTTSAAFSDELDYAPSIWLNRRSAFSTGTLDEQEADALATQLERELLSLRSPDTSVPLLQAVLRREHFANGPHAERCPDLMLIPAWPGGYRPSFLPTRPGDSTVQALAPEHMDAARGWGLAGTHRREGIFLASGANLPSMELPTLDIEQGGALVYSLAGLPIPLELSTALPAWLNDVLPHERSCAPQETPTAPTTTQPNDEDLTVARRLEALGYI